MENLFNIDKSRRLRKNELMPKSAKSSGGISEDTKTLITVLVLLFAYPVGLILMWAWTTWPKWLKIVVTLPVLLAIIGLFFAVILILVNPARQLEKARMQEQKYQQVSPSTLPSLAPRRSY